MRHEAATRPLLIVGISLVFVFLAGGQPVRAADLQQAIPKRKDLFKSLGCTSTHLATLEETVLDDRYSLVRAEWHWRFERSFEAVVEFTLPSSNAVPETGQMGQIVQASLAKIGCKVTLAPMDTTAYNSMVQAGTFQSNISIAGGTQWFPTRIAASSLYRFVNNTCWPNGTPPKAWMDGLNATDAQLDPAKQKEAVKPAVASFMDEMWSLPIAFRFTLYGMQKSISNFSFGVFDQPRLDGVAKA